MSILGDTALKSEYYRMILNCQALMSTILHLYISHCGIQQVFTVLMLAYDPFVYISLIPPVFLMAETIRSRILGGTVPVNLT